MNADWNLRYSRWVIDDGEPELHVGEDFEWFAISLWTEEALELSTERTRSAVPLDDGRYRVNGEIVYVSKDAKQSGFIIDFGIGAIADGLSLLPEECNEGDFVTGEVELLLPLCTAVHTHDLAHRWRVNNVSADLTPFVPSSVERVYVRDSSQILYKEVLGTDSVKAHSYLLNCTRLLK